MIRSKAGPMLVCGVTMLAGCALSSQMPALDQRLAPAQHGPHGVSNSAIGNQVRAPLIYEHNDSVDLTRYSVVTHPGQYFLWIQHPRVTFFVVTYGKALTEAPSSVFLVFRTQSPQEVATSHLEFTCDGVSEPLAAVPTARVEPGMLTTSLYQTFEIPTEQFRHLASCASAELSVGGVRAPFRADNMARLHSLADLLPPS